MGNVVLWKQRHLDLKAYGGRVKLVDDDKTFYKGRPVTWDRHATWAHAASARATAPWCR